jgi:hypothetical protein
MEASTRFQRKASEARQPVTGSGFLQAASEKEMCDAKDTMATPGCWRYKEQETSAEQRHK